MCSFRIFEASLRSSDAVKDKVSVKVYFFSSEGEDIILYIPAILFQICTLVAAQATMCSCQR